MRSKCGHRAGLHWNGEKLLHLEGPGRVQGSRREQPGMVVPGLSQQDKEEIKPGGIESPPPLFLSCRKGLSAVYRVLAELMAYSSSQILFSSIANILGENPAVKSSC